ncbi:hypothetical protein [Niallia sp. Krafla_26]|uniref:hypothetical protein n=1 Tax=Niallia sp. Krafla_26 TaxID=3064703 RepID=UPI003D17C57F
MKTWVKLFILMYLSVLFFGSFFAIGALSTGVMERTFPVISDIEVFLYYFFAGAIGGSLRHLYLFCVHYVKDELDNNRVWIMYIFYPIFATGTAIVAVTIIDSGILSIQFTEYDNTPYAPISVAFFVGFGFNRFIHKLNEVSKDLFVTNNK